MSMNGFQEVDENNHMPQIHNKCAVYEKCQWMDFVGIDLVEIKNFQQYLDWPVWLSIGGP